MKRLGTHSSKCVIYFFSKRGRGAYLQFSHKEGVEGDFTDRSLGSIALKWIMSIVFIELLYQKKVEKKKKQVEKIC